MALLTLLLLGVVGVPQTVMAQPSTESPLELQVKAAYVLNFINLTDWPPAAMATASSGVRICVAGNQRLRMAIENTVKNESAHGHAITVQPLAGAGPVQDCHVLVVSGTTEREAAVLLQSAAAAPVLAIGESDTFLRSGGALRFVVEQGHVRFDVNRANAERRGLTLSSRLLRVARSVE